MQFALENKVSECVKFELINSGYLQGGSKRCWALGSDMAIWIPDLNNSYSQTLLLKDKLPVSKEIQASPILHCGSGDSRPELHLL